VQENLWQPGGFGAAQWGLDAYGHAMAQLGTESHTNYQQEE
jgi:hypothetical protein